MNKAEKLMQVAYVFLLTVVGSAVWWIGVRQVIKNAMFSFDDPGPIIMSKSMVVIFLALYILAGIAAYLISHEVLLRLCLSIAYVVARKGNERIGLAVFKAPNPTVSDYHYLITKHSLLSLRVQRVIDRMMGFK